MSRKLISLLLAAVLLLTFGMNSALAVPYDATHASGKISFSGKVNVNIYSVTYHKNGGDGNAPVDSNKYAKNASVTLLGQGNMTAPSGKTFAGWSTNAKATSAEFLPGATVTITDNIDLYAVWSTGTAVNVTFTYTDSSSKIKTATKTYVKDETITMPTLTSLGWKEATGFSGWFEKADFSGTAIVPGTEKQITEECTFYGKADESATIEFPVTIEWDDANNIDGVRPSLNDVIKGIKLDPVPTTDVNVSAVDTSGNTWKIVYSNLNKADYTAVVNSVEGYSVTIKSKNSFTFVREVGNVSLTMWITNKKWDKNGDLIKFKPGQDVRFRIDVTNHGNRSVSHVVVYDTLKGCKIKKADGYRVSEGKAWIKTLEPGETVSIFATYRVTSSDQRKEKVVNVAGVDYLIRDSSWGTDWDAVRIPINKKSTATYGTTPTPSPSPTPAPSEYMIEKLIKDMATIMLAYPGSVIEISGAQEIMTPEEYAVYNTLSMQDKILTVLNTVGFNMLIPAERLRLNLTVSDQALNLMSTIYARKQTMSAEERAAQQAKESLYFPKQSVVIDGIMQNYFDVSIKVTTNNRSQVNRYTFREEINGQWSFVSMATDL